MGAAQTQRSLVTRTLFCTRHTIMGSVSDGQAELHIKLLPKISPLGVGKNTLQGLLATTTLGILKPSRGYFFLYKHSAPISQSDKKSHVTPQRYSLNHRYWLCLSVVGILSYEVNGLRVTIFMHHLTTPRLQIHGLWGTILWKRCSVDADTIVPHFGLINFSEVNPLTSEATLQTISQTFQGTERMAAHTEK